MIEQGKLNQKEGVRSNAEKLDPIPAKFNRSEKKFNPMDKKLNRRIEVQPNE